MTSSAGATGTPRPHRFTIPAPIGFAGLAVLLAVFFVAAGAPTPLLVVDQANWGFASSTLTLAFGVYAIALLVALLVFGSLSDYVGRKPLLIASVALELISIVMFLLADGVGWVIAARIVQGVATGAATSALSAAVVELAPAHRKRLGATLTSAAPAAGLGLGALFAGAVAQWSTVPNLVVWGVLAVVMLVGLVFVVFIPETVAAMPGAVASLVPRVSVPQHARGAFLRTLPLLVAAWVMGGLFLGLGPTILARLFDLHSALLNGAVTFTPPAIATIVSIAAVNVAPRRTLIVGGVSVVVGSAAVTAGVLLGSIAIFWIGGAIGGVGFGAVLSGLFRQLTPLAHPHERAGLFAAIYLAAYLAFGVPAILSGLLIAGLGLERVVLGYVVLVLITAGIGLALQRRGPAVPQERALA